MLIILWIILIGFLAIKNKENIYKMYVLIILSVPLNEKIYEAIGLKSFGISIIDILLVLLFILSLIQIIKKKVIPFSYCDFFIIIFSFLVLFYAYIGHRNGNIFIKSDLKVFVFMIITYFVFRVNIFFEDNGREYIKIITYSIIIYSAAIIFIFLFRDTILPFVYNENLLLWWGTKRVAFSNGCIVLLLPLILSIKGNIVSRKVKGIAIIVSFISVILSQSRALILIYLGVMIIGLIVVNIKKNTGLIFVFLVITTITVIFFTVIFRNEMIDYIISLNNTTLNRFAQLLNNDFIDNNVRTITNELCMNVIKGNKYMGFGLGKEIALYKIDSSIASVSSFIDNGFLTLILKMGFVAIIPIIGLAISIIIKAIKLNNVNVNIKFLILVTIVGFIFTTGIINAQIIYSTPITTITVIAIAILERKT